MLPTITARQIVPCVAASSVPVRSVTAASASRRNAVMQLVATPLLFASAPALALIVDDSDEELIEKLSSRRKEKLAQERSVERDFARTEGFVDKETERELIPVQRAVKKLAQSGKALESGDLKAVSAALGGSWVSELEAAGKDLSGSDTVRAKLAPVIKNIAELKGATDNGNLRAAKQSFVSTVEALSTWVVAAGIEASIKGI